MCNPVKKQERPSIFANLSNQRRELPTYRCCICGEEHRGFGNNPYPLRDNGRCCDRCNGLVIVERIRRMERR